MYRSMKRVHNEPLDRAQTSDASPGLWRLLREDYETHGRDATRPGFQALAVYRFGVARMRVKAKPLRAPLSVLYRALFRGVRNFYGIELPYTAQVGRRVVFEHQHGIVVHGSSVIGDECVIRQGVTLGIRRLDALDAAPVLGKGVDVGAGAKILGHVHVGDGAAIGANAVVLDDVPAGKVAVGIPARVSTRPLRAVPNPAPLRAVKSS
jgi:serine O-acetyltransferase